MGSPGTKNAAIIWKVVYSNDKPMSEADIRGATGLGVGTVHRLVRTMETQGFLSSQKAHQSHPTCGRQSVAFYTAKKTIEDVRAAMCPPVAAPRPAERPSSYFGQGMRRVASVWELGSPA